MSTVLPCPICGHEEHCDPVGGEAWDCSVEECLCLVCPDCGGDDYGCVPCTRCGGEGVAA